MLTVSGLKNFYYLPHFYDMRCGYARIMEVVRMSYHRNPYKGDVFSLCPRTNAVFAW
jgi:IS66 Orf2 like protein.